MRAAAASHGRLRVNGDRDEPRDVHMNIWAQPVDKTQAPVSPHAPCRFEALPAGRIFTVVCAQGRPHAVPSEFVLRTAGAELAMAAGASDAPRPLLHCAHFQSRRMCRLGPDCSFIHSKIPPSRGDDGVADRAPPTDFGPRYTPPTATAPSHVGYGFPAYAPWLHSAPPPPAALAAPYYGYAPAGYAPTGYAPTGYAPFSPFYAPAPYYPQPVPVIPKLVPVPARPPTRLLPAPPTPPVVRAPHHDPQAAAGVPVAPHAGDGRKHEAESGYRPASDELDVWSQLAAIADRNGATAVAAAPAEASDRDKPEAAAAALAYGAATPEAELKAADGPTPSVKYASVADPTDSPSLEAEPHTQPTVRSGEGSLLPGSSSSSVAATVSSELPSADSLESNSSPTLLPPAPVGESEPSTPRHRTAATLTAAALRELQGPQPMDAVKTFADGEALRVKVSAEAAAT